MDDDAKQRLAMLNLRYLALRDIVIQLLSQSATTSENPETFLKEFSDAGLRRAYQPPLSGEINEAAAQVLADETDRIVSLALGLSKRG